jgi:CubicO group peptidase (beta-lactamase class C family)
LGARNAKVKMTGKLALKSFHRDQFKRTREVLQGGVLEGVSPGMVGGFWRKSDPETVYCEAVGQRRIHPAPLPITPETVFDLASLTKVLATAPLIARLIDRGWLEWTTPVRLIFPDYPDPEIRIEHLLSHTAGFPAWSPFWERIREKYLPQPVYRFPIRDRQALMRKLVFSVPREVPIGTRALYSDISFLLLGFIAEEVTRKPFDRAVKEFLWKPMGVDGAFFKRVKSSCENGRMESLASTEDSEWRGGVLQGQVHDDNTWAMGGYAGHAGMFGGAREVMGVVRSLFDGFLNPKSLEKMWTRATPPPGCERTYGWDTPTGKTSSAGKYFSPHSVGHLGFTGTSLWIDLDSELAVTLLTNRVHFGRDNMKIREFRPRFHDAIRLDLAEANLSSLGRGC